MAGQISSFLSRDDPATLIVYGLVSEPLRVLEQLERDPKVRAPLTDRYALLTPRHADLRLSSSGWIDVTYEQRMALTDPADLFQLCRHRILRSVSLFAKPTRQFLDAYLDFVWTRTDTCRDELEKHGSGDEVFGAADWVFSAWLPLPQARILLPGEFERDPPEFAEIDIAFWHDGRVLAVVIESASTPAKSKKRRLDFLCEYHPCLEMVSIPRSQIADGRFPADAFPSSFSRYWQDLPLPTGLAPPAL